MVDVGQTTRLSPLEFTSKPLAAIDNSPLVGHVFPVPFTTNVKAVCLSVVLHSSLGAELWPLGGDCSLDAVLNLEVQVLDLLEREFQ